MAAKKLPAITGLHSQGIVDDVILPLARKGLRTVAKKQVKIGSKQFDKGSVKSMRKGMGNLTKSVKNNDKADALALKQGLMYKNKQAKGIGDKLVASSGDKFKGKAADAAQTRVKKNKKKLATLRDSEMRQSNINSFKGLNALFMSPVKPANYAAQSRKYRTAVQKQAQREARKGK